MKYTDKNKPLVCMQTHSNCYVGTSKNMTVKGVLWHSTGANNPNLKRYVQPYNKTSTGREDPSNTYTDKEWVTVLGNNTNNNDWNHIDREAGLNCWIGKLANGTVTTVQTMPWTYKPWGCGSGRNGSCNSGWIQFEICEDSLNDRAYFNAAYQEACEITAYLCKMYNINPKGTVSHGGVNVPTILCHQDSYKLGLGGNHGDIYNWFPKHGKSMATVRNDVAALMSGATFKLTPESASGGGIIAETLEPIEPTLIHKLKLEGVSKCSASAKLVVGETYTNYQWKFKVIQLKDNRTVVDKSLTIKGTETTVSITNLIPNNTYRLEISAKDSLSNITKSPDIIFTTSQDYPEAVKKVTCVVQDFLKDNASCLISFEPNTSWGAYSRSSKGYRTSLFINGIEKGSNDSFFTSSSAKTKNISFNSLLNTFNIPAIKLTDTIQIGIQPWVKDENNKYVFAEGFPCCSKPIYLQHYLCTVDKVYLNIDGTSERVVTHLNIE